MDDTCHAINVNAACRNIGRDERLHTTIFERFQRFIALPLRATTVNGIRTNPRVLELLREAICTVTRLGEHERCSVFADNIHRARRT